MGALTVYLLERIGLLLMLVILITRIPSFRRLINSKLDGKTILFQSLMFGLLVLLGTQTGLLGEHNMFPASFTHWHDQDTLIGSTLFIIVIAGLIGGPIVGTGSGLVVALFLFITKGDVMVASMMINPITGFLAGLMARFFSDERIIAPGKAFFISMFAPILHMGLLLILTDDPDATIQLVNRIGLPLVFTNSLAIAVFASMLHIILNEADQKAVFETSRALKIVDKALPYLKDGFHQNADASKKIAHLLQQELDIPAAAITNQTSILAHVGIGADHHRQGEKILTALSQRAFESGEIQVTYYQDEIQCREWDCPLRAAIIVPIKQSDKIIGLIKLYFKKQQEIRSVEIALAKGLGNLISNQLDIILLQTMKQHLQEAELRGLQAQINPHFLFNTLHLIDTQIRVNPVLARHLIVQLSTFMRYNFKIATEPLIPFDKELEHVRAYLEIVNARFSDQFHVTIEAPKRSITAAIPPFTLQPLIENSIQHGLRDKEADGKIAVIVNLLQKEIEVEVMDNGDGIPMDLLAKLGKETVISHDGNGTGLYNVNQRLINLLGERSRLKFENCHNGGSCIYFRLPLYKTGELSNEI